jgi:uncharacterized Ntn-hydrolase superfamily protein
MMTYSILGRAEGTGDLGVAVQSRFPGVGSLVAVDLEVLADLRRRYGCRPAG